ncbi:SprB-like repeat protein [Flavobacterium sp. 1]|uniref:MBG domain-containing protein n=1 Tax=Flavobacterium sp. 1 TaxID=2035200 RepID=UPI000CB33930|nr:MBG domain-containing protein [Flavobacterium sp. 1]PJJ06974.1 SprB-like repeat protein [Flavobacterium sp. 1]
MFKKLLFLGCFLYMITSSNAQTLSTGDIAIIGVNYDTSPNYEITIVTLAPILANTQIRISDYWYNESTPNTLTNVQASTSTALDTEGGILWQPTSDISAGTIFKIGITKGGNTVTGLPGTVTVTGWTNAATTTSPGNAGGDNWFIYQGSSITSVSNFIFLWGNAFTSTINGVAITPGTFVTTGSGNLSSNSATYLPPSLTLGTNAIALTTVTYHGDNNVYTGITTGTKATILAEICNLSKWNHNEATTYDIAPGGTSFPGSNPIFTLSTPNTAPTDIALSASAINENVSANSAVGTLSSTDADASNTFTYTLVAGTGSTDNTAFSITGNSLTINASPDFETKSSYSVRIRTTDQGGLTFEKQFTITINDLAEGVLLNTSPTLTFTSNPAAITSDDIASDGEGGSQTISDIDIQVYNISNSNGTLLPALSWQNNSFLSSANNSYSGLTNENNAGSKGMAIKSADGSEFRLNQFIYYNWGETSSFTNTVKGYKDGSEVASTTFDGFDSGYNPKTITLTSAFQNVDEVRFYISAGGYMGDQSSTNHSINSFALTSPVVTSNTAPTDVALSATSINENVSANSAVGTLSSTDADASNTFTYTLVAGTGSTDNSAFAITGNSLTINASPDFETKSSYSVRIRTTDQGGLSFEKVFAVTVNNLCDIVLTSASQTNIACNGGSTGAATVNAATGGTGPYTYNWTPSNPTGDGTVSVTGLTPGVWTCTVTDANSCTATRNFTITQPTAISTATAAQTNVSCNGGTNGSASVTPSGGAGGYTYSWSPSGGTAATATGLAAGSYTVTVTDANGCTATRNYTITQPTAISTATGSQTNVSCNGGTNGSASVSPSGGTPGYTYSWSPSGGTAATATGLAAGSYTVTVTDANGCTATRNYTITQPTAISTATGSQTNVSCNGGTNGSASVSPSGGTPGYTYSWSPSGGTAATATGLAAGSYTVTVTDANGCTATRNYTITQPTAISTATGSQTNVSCNGGTNGSASVSPSGGTPGYTYSWSPSGGTAATATGLAAGSYTVTVTDANGCTATRNYTITQPTAISTATGSQTNVSCNGGTNGSASVSPSGGTPGYTYSWSPSGGTAATATGLAAGSYTVTVTDANGCTATRNYTITQPTAISTATGSQTNVSCNGGTNGSASVSPSGGTPGYTYSWSPSGGTAATATGLAAGSYTVTVTDANGCTATRNYTITQPTAISTATGSQTNVSCNGGTNGSASVSPSGGTPGYTYSWSPSGGTAATATGLAAGSYTVTVTDANGCTATRNYTITQPTAISTATGSQTNVSCNGGTNGSASVSPSGGTPGYTYSWSPSGGTAATATGLAAGSYTVTVTDANGCTATRNYTITQPTAISTATGSQTNVSCNGGTNGSASVSPSGGTPGYTYSWSPSGGTAATATGLAAGSYTVTVTDANGCTATRNYTITQPTAISTATGSQTNVSCNGGTNGSASVSPSGGTPGYTYSWSPSGGTAATATGLAAGSYTVTVTDANGCTATRNYTITQPTAISTATGSQTNVSCNGGTNGSASVSPSGGTPGYTYSWSPSGGTAATATGLAAGSYTVTVTDANGCTATRNYTITQPSAISTATGSQTNVSCNGGTNGSASVSPSGGTPGYTYSWSPSGGTAATATGLAAGSYTVTVTDANGCTATRNYTITQPSAISTATGSQTNVSCNGGTNGSASVSPSGGTPGYTYSWSPSGGTAATATGLAAGSYTVTVTDANGCTATRNYTITQPTAISTATGSQTNVSCNGGTNGSASVSPSGGTPGYTYSWSPSGGTAATATGLAAGSYTVTVTDANGCTATRNYTITQPTAISTATGSQTNVSCNGGTNGSASVSPSGGTPGYTYSWSPSGGTAATATGLAAGSYTVTVTDANGCTATRNYTITQPTAISTATGSQTNVSCNGGTNGSASVSPSGGTPGYTYSWSPSGGTAATATGLAAGSYTVTVTDANGCTATRNYTITQPTAISTATGSQTNVSCNGGTNGSASVSPSGGTPGYTYSWSPSGGTAATATGLAAGSYTVTVTDANGCTATRNYTITQPTAISTATGSQTNVPCNGGTNGSASVTPSGGAGAYTYSWSPSGGTAATATGLSAGAYTVTVTDANGCTATRNFTITQPTVISTATAAQTNVSCNGGTNGSASVTPSGGAGAYTYSWSPSGGTAATATGLSAGAYTVTVTDANGCTATRNFTITQPTVISTATAAQTNVSCNGGTNGSASVTPSGGAGAYTYSWSPSGGTAATATGLSAGAYTVTVTDANGCTATRNFTITQPTEINFTTTVLSGYDYNTGYSQTIVASGGTGSKTYAVTAGSLPSGFSLSTAGQITGISTQIADSNFTVTATDANSCTATYNYILKLNQIPITVTAIPSQTKVYGESDPVLTYTLSPSLLSGDSFTGSLTRVSGENIGNYAINQGSLSAGSKYLITYVGANFTITAKPITVTVTPSQTKVYGTTDPVFDYTVSPGLVGSDSFTGALTRVAGENIGTYAINQGSLSAGSNYTISYAGANFTITAKPITVTATPSQTKVYGTTDPVFAYTVSPSLIGSDAFTGTLTRVAGENIGNYAINQGSLTAGSNYTISYVSANFTITAKPITVTATASQTKVYGTTNPVFAYTVSPSLVGSDAFTGALTRVPGENIGNYAITLGNLSAGTNYNITYVSKDFTITAKPITVTANTSQTKVYGTTDPVFTYTVSPSLVGSDAFTGALTRAAGVNVGVYAITQGTLSAGGNYTITYNGSNFTITKADQVITWNQTLELGCNGETSIVLTAVANSGLAVNYASSNTNIATVSNNSLIFQNYGSATITASQPGNMNYNAAPAVVLPVVSSQPNLIRKQFENIIFFDNSSKSFKSYSWYKNGVLVPGQTSQYFKESGALNGTYYAVATKLDGTLITTCTLTFSPTIEEEYIRIVPNPVRSNASFQLMTNVSTSRLQNARVELYNLTGNLLTTITNPSQNTIDMSAPSVEGIYIVKMTLANGKYFTKNLLVKN